MSGAEEISIVHGADQKEGPATPGMSRREAFATDSLWAGSVSTEPGMVSGWHHHAEHDTIIYVLTGELLLEYGLGGAGSVHARSGDFVFVPRATVHRESNPSTVPADLVAVRVGEGETLVNVPGPEQAT
jgi:uncharacterized RmlC-like cupin family protein